MSETKKCMGACEEHRGEVRLFNVTDPKHDTDWGDFWYCQEAVALDTGRGFMVTEVAPEEAPTP